MEKGCDLKCYFIRNCGNHHQEHKINRKRSLSLQSSPLSLRRVQLDLHQVPPSAQRTSETLNDTPSLTMALGIRVTNHII